MSERSEKLLNGPNQTRFRITGLFTLQKELLPGNLLLRKVLLLKVCELIEKTPSLWLGKVTSPLTSASSQSSPTSSFSPLTSTASPSPSTSSLPSAINVVVLFFRGDFQGVFSPPSVCYKHEKGQQGLVIAWIGIRGNELFPLFVPQTFLGQPKRTP